MPQKQYSMSFKPNLVGENNKLKWIGSTQGKILYFLGFIFCVVQIQSLMSDMLNYRNTKFSTQQFKNNFEKDQYFNMLDSPFLPTFQVYKWEDFTSAQHDIFQIYQNFVKIIEIRINEGLNISLIYIFLYQLIIIQQSVTVGTITATVVDIQKLSRYFSIVLNLRKRRAEGDKFVHIKYRGYFNDLDKAIKQLCPEIENLKSDFSIMNNYATYKRDSFSVEFLKCIPSQQPAGFECKTDSEIQDLKTKIWFNQYLIDEKTDLLDKQKLFKRPTSVNVVLKDQFQLTSLPKFQLNHIIPNEILIQDDIWDSNETPKQYFNFQVDRFIQYEGQPYTETTDVSLDGGLTYQSHTYSPLHSSYYFLADDKITHIRRVQNFYDVLGNIGGIVNVIFSLITFFSISLNYNFIMADFIKAMYYPFYDSNQKRSNDPKSSQFEFSYLDRLSLVWWFRPFFQIITYLKINKNNDNSNLFLRLKQNIQQEMNFINQVKRQQKVITILSQIIQNPIFKQDIAQAEKNYINHLQNIHKDQDINNSIYDIVDDFGINSKSKQENSNLKQENSNLKQEIQQNQLSNNQVATLTVQSQYKYEIELQKSENLFNENLIQQQQQQLESQVQSNFQIDEKSQEIQKNEDKQNLKKNNLSQIQSKNSSEIQQKKIDESQILSFNMI